MIGSMTIHFEIFIGNILMLSITKLLKKSFTLKLGSKPLLGVAQRSVINIEKDRFFDAHWI